MHLLILHLLLGNAGWHLVRVILSCSFVLQEGLLSISPTHTVVHIILRWLVILVLVISVSGFLVLPASLPALGCSLFPSLDRTDYTDDYSDGGNDGTDNQ